MMQAYTEEQRAALIQFNRAIIAQHDAYAVPEAAWPEYVQLMVSSARIALAALTAEVHSYTFEEDPRPLYTTPQVAALRLPESWKELEEMADAAPVAHALSEFLEDATGDNGARVAEAVIAEIKRLNTTAPAEEKK